MACGIATLTHTCPLGESRIELRASLSAKQSSYSSCISPLRI